MAEPLSAEELARLRELDAADNWSTADVEELHRALPRLLAEHERLTRERDEARAALRWLASRYQRLTPSGPYQRYGGGVTDEEWDAHVATALAEGA